MNLPKHILESLNDLESINIQTEPDKIILKGTKVYYGNIFIGWALNESTSLSPDEFTVVSN